MKPQDLIGEYNIIGANQDEKEITYKGTLSLSIDNNNRINAKWLINNTQEQVGTGFFKNNILVINFKYLGINKNVYKGVVVYQYITPDILDGFWSEEQADPSFLGEEKCFKVKTEKKLLN